MGGQATAAVAAAEAVLQEAATAVAKQIRKAIPEAQNMFPDEAADPATLHDDVDNTSFPAQASAEDSDDQVSIFAVSAVCYNLLSSSTTVRLSAATSS